MQGRPLFVWLIFIFYLLIEAWTIWRFYGYWTGDTPLPSALAKYYTKLPLGTFIAGVLLSLGLLYSAWLLFNMHRWALYAFGFYTLLFLGATGWHLLATEMLSILAAFGTKWLALSAVIKGLTFGYAKSLDSRGLLSNH